MAARGRRRRQRQGERLVVFCVGGGAFVQPTVLRGPRAGICASARMRRVVVWFALLVVCCAALSEAVADAELGQNAGVLEEQRAEEVARRSQAIRELQAHAKQGYRPGADVMEGARDGGALSLSEYMQALLGWDDATWATMKRIGTYGCVCCASPSRWMR